MRICVFGAGAIGGYLAVGLAVAKHEVSVIARGAHLDAIQRNGLGLISGDHETRVTVIAKENPVDLGAQDVVICALKAHQAWQLASEFKPLFGAETAIVTAMNGFPWWYFHGTSGALPRWSLTSVDPGDRQWQMIGPERAIGCVVEPACEVIAPGVIRHRKNNRFTLGEPDGSRSPRVRAISQALTDAGFDAPVRINIRDHIWLKLLGNVCFNPISMLTLATIDRVVTEPSLRALCRSIMEEAAEVAEALGIRIPRSMIERRLDAAAAMVGHKMSMLQDLERGRDPELGAIVEAVQEVGRLLGVPTPTLDIVLSLAQARTRLS